MSVGDHDAPYAAAPPWHTGGLVAYLTEAAQLERDLTLALWETPPERWGHLVTIDRIGFVPPAPACTWPEPLAPTPIEAPHG